MPRGMNKGAYRGKLTCPVCQSEAIRYLENVNMYRLRYRCRKCGMSFQYDISNAPPGSRDAHPYAPFKKGVWRDIVDRYEGGQRRRKR